MIMAGPAHSMNEGALHPGRLLSSNALPLADLSNITITGWYVPACRDREYVPTFEAFCETTLLERLDDEPIALDPTGQTCYVNPWYNTTVFWVGPWTDREANNTTQATAALFGMHFTNERAASRYLLDCSSLGVCPCDALEPIRQNWRTRTTDRNGNGGWCTLTDYVDICFESEMTKVGFLLDVDKGDFCQPLARGFDEADSGLSAINYGDTTGAIVCHAAVQLWLGEGDTIPPTGSPTSASYSSNYANPKGRPWWLTFRLVVTVLMAMLLEA
jgi:hypothetical protein